MVLGAMTATCQGVGQGLRIRQLTGNKYVFTTWKALDGKPYPSNALYVVTRAGVVMLDTPWDTAQFQPLLDSIQKKHHARVIMCLATHWHEDRTIGLAYYAQQGISTYTTLMTDVLSDQHGMPRAAHMMTKDTAFDIGGTKFLVYYPGVGHSPDNIVVWFPVDRILYGGCLLKSLETEDMGNLGSADIYTWSKSIRKIRAKFGKASYVIPGHMAWGGDKLLDHTLELIHEEIEHRKEEGEEDD
jgi:metallo-beta-lactamase class B